MNSIIFDTFIHLATISKFNSDHYEHEYVNVQDNYEYAKRYFDCSVTFLSGYDRRELLDFWERAYYNPDYSQDFIDCLYILRKKYFNTEDISSIEKTQMIFDSIFEIV